MSFSTITTITLLCLQCFFHEAVKHNGNEQSLQLSFITGFDKNYLHASLLELWRWVRGLGARGGFSLLLQICTSTPKQDADKLWWTWIKVGVRRG